MYIKTNKNAYYQVGNLKLSLAVFLSTTSYKRVQPTLVVVSYRSGENFSEDKWRMIAGGEPSLLGGIGRRCASVGFHYVHGSAPNLQTGPTGLALASITKYGRHYVSIKKQNKMAIKKKVLPTYVLLT